MLKIKDFVDLKELEKFGFDLRAGESVGTNDFSDPYVDDNYGELICGNIIVKDSPRYEWNRNIEFMCFSVSNKDFELLYDLIQAGLVEKVSD